MSAFVMPSLGADMEAGTLVEWLKNPGDEISHGDIVAVVETQKGAIEIEAFEDGVLQGYLAEIGQKVPVGTPIADILKASEAAGAVEAPATIPAETGTDLSQATLPVEPPRPEPAQPLRTSSSGDRARVKISPAARRLAEAAGLDLTKLSGTGPGGVIVLDDVTRRISKKTGAQDMPAQQTTAGSAPESDKMAAMRAAIAAAMSRSKREIPHFYLSHTADLTKAERFVADVNAGRDPASRLLLGAVTLKAAAKALKKYPEFNGHYGTEGFVPSTAVHLGVAIKIRGGGLVAPAIHNAQDLSLDTLMAKMRDLVDRVRAGRFRASELSDPTITVSSLGERGVEAMFPVIYPPQVAIVGIGSPIEKPWAEQGEVSARRTTVLTLAADHRVSDGHRGALFLSAIAKHLLTPEKL